MSDPVKNHELEDVLSSIRRLVSEDGYGGSTPENTDDIPTEVAEVAIGRKLPNAPETDKLVLTEAFLVSESETTDLVENRISAVETLVLGQDQSINLSDDAGTFEAPSGDVLVLNSVFDGLHSEDDTPDETITEVSSEDDTLAEDINDDEPDDINGEETLAENDVEKDARDDVSDTVEVTEETAEAYENSDADDRDDAPVDDVVEYASLDEDSEPDVDDVTVDDMDEPHAHAVELEPEQIQPLSLQDSDQIEDAITLETDESASVEQQFSEPSGLAHTVAELEAVISAQNDDWEPDGSEEDGATPDIEPLEWRSEATRGAKVFDMPRAEAAPTMPGFQGETELDDIDYGLEDFSEDDAPFLDEAALRDMVSDIVRQELQGPLGERITRNVRKLVRREIHRILASEDFD